ncbi:MucR family transcriptional regulator [Sphingomonas koreensis]|uniref:MucR family transcriptional regulator n=1 Tax=Sphingomonas koreensis TaxID=93064 RepID=UPI00234EF242|nr:MucR family transcriptional regulator [Sphingomonas koreensis]MDC7812182.1 MucR family transcriptional regulator [Sphingomonas koreensis]
MSEENNLVAMTIEVVASYVAHNNIRPEDVPDFIAKTHAAISGIAKEAEPPAADAPPVEAEFTPAVTVRKSLASPDHILSMIDGKPYKSLKRHLGRHGLTPADYRARYGLKSDYPMVAPGYSAQRREVAQRLGLGRKKASTAPTSTDESGPVTTTAAPAKRSRGGSARTSSAPAPAKQPRRRKGQSETTSQEG